MTSVYVGTYPRHLASGRPLVFGDVVDAKDLTAEDDALKPFLVEQASEPKATGPDTTTTEDK